MPKLNAPQKPSHRNQKGQTFLEFIFMLLIMVTLSFAFLKGFRSGIGERWETLLNIISRPESSFRMP